MLCEWWGGVNRCSHMKLEMSFLVEATSVTMGVSWSSAGREMGRDVRERPQTASGRADTPHPVPESRGGNGPWTNAAGMVNVQCLGFNENSSVFGVADCTRA